MVTVMPAEGHKLGQCLQHILEKSSNKNEILAGTGYCWPNELGASVFHLQEGRRFKGKMIWSSAISGHIQTYREPHQSSKTQLHILASH